MRQLWGRHRDCPDTTMRWDKHGRLWLWSKQKSSFSSPAKQSYKDYIVNTVVLTIIIIKFAKDLSRWKLQRYDAVVTSYKGINQRTNVNLLLSSIRNLVRYCIAMYWWLGNISWLVAYCIFSVTELRPIKLYKCDGKTV